MRNIFHLPLILLIWTLSHVPFAMAEGDAVIAVAADGDTVEALVSKQRPAPPISSCSMPGSPGRGDGQPLSAGSARRRAAAVDTVAAKGVLTLRRRVRPQDGCRHAGQGMTARTATGSAADAVRHPKEK